MKIIERKSAYPKRIKCEKCTSILEYDANDIVLTSDPHSLIRGFYRMPCMRLQNVSVPVK